MEGVHCAVRIASLNKTDLIKLVQKIEKSDYELYHVRPSIRPTVRIEQLDSRWTDFDET